MKTAVAIGALLLASHAAAQTWVWPPAYATRAGEGVLNTPFSVLPGLANNSSRLLIVLKASSIPFPTNTVLHEIAFRRDAQYGSTSYSGVSGHLRIQLGSTLVDPDRINDAAMGSLWNGNPQWCVDADVNLPPVGPNSGVPAFSAIFPFYSPFTWTGGNLVIDVLFSASPTTTWRIDAMAPPTRRNGTFQMLGPGCRGSNGFLPITYALFDTTAPGDTLVLHLDQARTPPNQQAVENIALSWLGASNTQYAGLPLPMDLAPFGLPSGCRLRTDLLVAQAALVGNPSAMYARSESRWPLPNDRSLVGATFFSQWLLNDTALTSPLRLTVSDALAITPGTPDPAPHRWIGSVVWQYGATGYDHDAGFVPLQELAPVMQFR